MNCPLINCCLANLPSHLLSSENILKESREFSRPTFRNSQHRYLGHPENLKYLMLGTNLAGKNRLYTNLATTCFYGSSTQNYKTSITTFITFCKKFFNCKYLLIDKGKNLTAILTMGLYIL